MKISLSVKNYFQDFLKKHFAEDQSADNNREFWVYLAGNVVLTLFFMNVFFWLLWTLLVYKGGIFVKIMPLISAIFTDKSFKDFGYEGWPYELGIFDGMIENLVALVLFVAFVVLCWVTYNKFSKRAKLPSEKIGLSENFEDK